MSRSEHRPGFTITELLVVIGLITVLLGLLLPALSGVWSTGKMTSSMNNMRQISLWMRQYSSDHEDFIVPSRFSYVDAEFPGKARSNTNPQTGEANTGTWTDILTTVFEVSAFPDAEVKWQNDYRFDSPDKPLYDLLGDGAINNPFRAAAPNTRDAPGSSTDALPTPFGSGATEIGYAGFFAANDFFAAGWPGVSGGAFFSNGQIRFPDRSMYLVDSFYGETILPTPEAFDATIDALSDGTGEVDFRYGNDEVCLMLFLDGHIDPEGRWTTIDDLEGDPGDDEDHGRGIRIRNLTTR
jgi:type II secretory pathway pseudopilin PulG